MRTKDILKIKKVLNQVHRELQPDSRLLSIAITDIQKAGWALAEAIKEQGISTAQAAKVPEAEVIISSEKIAPVRKPKKRTTKPIVSVRPKEEEEEEEDDLNFDDLANLDELD